MRVARETEGYHQALVIKNAFHICHKGVAFRLSLLILLVSDIWLLPKPF